MNLMSRVFNIWLLFSYVFLLINTCSSAHGFIFAYQLQEEVVLSLMVYVLD